MNRRTFVKSTSLVAVSIGVFGKISWSETKFIGDTPTTTDILGPAYRPGGPFRININPSNFTSSPLHLAGTIYKDDGKTLFENCMIEIWQCDKQGEYDMISEDYLYRGAMKTKKDGAYHFITTQPIAYFRNNQKKTYRPAHIHLRVSGGEGEQDLITQIYFKGDPHIAEDEYASSQNAVKRILEINKNNKGEEEITFDIIMSKEFPLDKAAFRKIAGVYTLENNSFIRFYRKGDLLFMNQGEQIQEAFFYKGNNYFESGAGDLTAKFELKPNGETKLTGTFLDDNKKLHTINGKKTFAYPD
jgi:catechol 1,2-dioxygenase